MEARSNKIDGRVKDTRQRILREATNLYNQGGYAGINLQELATTVGITKAALFHHFDSKQALFCDMQLEVCKSQQISIEAAIAEGYDTRSRLRNIMVAMSQRPFFDPMKFLTDEIHQLNQAQQQQVHQAFSDSIRQPVARVIEQGLKTGELRPHNQKIAILTFLNLMMLLPSPGNPVTRDMPPSEQETYIDELLDSYLTGIAINNS